METILIIIAILFYLAMWAATAYTFLNDTDDCGLERFKTIICAFVVAWLFFPFIVGELIGKKYEEMNNRKLQK